MDTDVDRADIVFLIDTSTQQQSFPAFILQTDVLDAFINRLPILNLSPNNTQVAAVFYSSSVHETVWLNTTHDAAQFAQILSGAKQDRENTTSNLAVALRHVREDVFSDRHGARSNARKFVVYPNSGNDVSGKLTSQEIQNLKNDNVLIVCIGLGKYFDDIEVLKSASAAVLAVFADEKVTDENVRMLLKQVKYTECTARVNS